MQEDRVFEFIRDHEDFWWCGTLNYKCRKQVLGVLATELEVDLNGLPVWWKSLHDWNRRIHKQKSGDKLKLRTDQENWLVQKLAFSKVEEELGDSAAPAPVVCVPRQRQVLPPLYFDEEEEMEYSAPPALEPEGDLAALPTLPGGNVDLEALERDAPGSGSQASSTSVHVYVCVCIYSP
jgi:hypothetical protein